jgi:hypothetical protein
MRTSKQARKTFDQEIVGKNVMTPNRMYVGYTKDGGIWELCEGDDFDRKLMYGVTVIINDPVQGWHLDSERSVLFAEGKRLDRINAAIKYIEEELQ